MTKKKQPRDKTTAPVRRDAWMTIDQRVVPALLKHLVPRGPIWEPAAGRGDMSEVLKAAGFNVYETDVFGYKRLVGGQIRDFFSFQQAPACCSIITNPPNSLNLEFAIHAIKLMEPVKGVVALYQRHEWDTTKESSVIFDHQAFAMKIIPRFRPRWIKPKRGEKAGSPFYRFSWFVWDWENKSPPIIKFS